MPRVSLYIDEKTLKRIEIAAKTEGLSLSRYVSTKLRASLDDQWPEHYEELFGAIKDDTFERYSIDTPDSQREKAEDSKP